MSEHHPDDPTRVIAWDSGRAELQRLGAMLGPVWFSADGHPDFAPLQVAPWFAEPGAAALPGILRRLRGDWPCVPFGRTDRPEGLPAGWALREPGDACGHGYAANHEWDWLETDDPQVLALAIEPPGPVKRMTRVVEVEAHARALLMTLVIEMRAPATLPIALHPTLRLDLGSVRLALPAHEGGVVYPVPAEPGVSLLAPDARFERLDQVPLAAGGTLDLTRYPLAADSEELLQLRELDGPVALHYVDAGWTLQLDWDHRALPDLMLWVSHRGRAYPPWNGRHLALGVEPVRGPFDLGRVAAPPAEHPLADRRGLWLTPEEPFILRHRISANPA